ncbi:MAG: Oxidoreductase domain protein [Pedosphaera sp.]|nr:Oxidoreductase domain protein [Pedosphaera sp.]
MSQNEADKGQTDLNRREFVKSAASFGGMMLLMGGVPLHAEDKGASASALVDTNFGTEDPPVNSAVIGCGVRGREIIQTLNLLPDANKTLRNAPVVAICDTYKPFLKKAKDLAPGAEEFEDYRKVLELKNVDTVFVATPTHLHREIVVAALQAGKHVYCEAPLAHTIEDARAIAQAAKAAEKSNFQAGLQMRADPGKKFVLDFIHTGAVGTPVMARSQWHKRTSWRRPGTSAEREKALNWRLDSATSAGLAGEVGVHQLDLMTWMLGKKPIAVTGFGSILDPSLQDGRDIADTIQTIMHYPGKVNAFFDCSLANSFDGEYDVLYGTGAAIMFRPEDAGQKFTAAKAWLFEEPDSQLFGWEIYATKEQFYRETGITLSAGASHSVQPGKVAVESPYADSTLHHSLKAFLHNSLWTTRAVKNFVSSYGADAEGLGESLAASSKGRYHAAGYKEGFEATVLAIKTNEAVVKGEKVLLPKEIFDI